VKNTTAVPNIDDEFMHMIESRSREMVIELSRGLPERFKRARVLVVAGNDRRTLLSTFDRMGIANVSCVGEMAAARELCEAGRVDACFVMLPRAVPDEAPAWDADTEAPGKGRVPSLLMAEATTPYVRRNAADAGYRAVIPFAVSFRMLYRCVGALLQAGKPGQTLHTRVRSLGGTRVFGGDALGTGKPKLQ
jgi:hypothetical protein